MHSELIVFNGIRFRRYPESERRSDRVYFTPGAWDKAKGIGRLHEEIWKAEHGPIPDGHHIHHADHDALNNDPSNLVCITSDEHKKHHANSDDARARFESDEWQAHLTSIRPAAAEWHSSPEGVEWHREHARRIMAARPLLPGICDQCGNAFVSKLPLRFCSNKCKSAWRRASGLDDEQRTCSHCGAQFTVNRYSKKTNCSRSCASTAARAAERARRLT